MMKYRMQEKNEKNYNKKPSRRIPMWLPYVAEIQAKKREVHIVYKGGEVTRQYAKIHSIMFYGAVPTLSQYFLERCAAYDVPIVIHRRNMPKAVWIQGSIGSMREDNLSLQISYRNNLKKRTYIARRFLNAKFKSMEWLVPYPSDFKRKYQNIDEMRMREAQHARRYWDRYYERLGFSQYSRREKGNMLSSALDAVSKFISGIILRWVIYHNLSPSHGFLHEPTDYPSLVFDIIEPYRGYIEKAVFDATRLLMKKEGKTLENIMTSQDFTAFAIYSVEELMDTKVYTPSTRQIVSFQELIHGAIISLVSYMERRSQKFIIPMPGKANGGRPRKVGYRLYGRHAGPTDFWTEARELGMIYDKFHIKNRTPR